MPKDILRLASMILIFNLIACSSQMIRFKNENLDVINRGIVSINDTKSTLALDRKMGDGMAIIKDLEFDKGVIELELKGENKPGQSFIGIAFNIQNDTTYEAIYFRPFNFRSVEEMRRQHSVQYIHHPKYTWRFLRTNYEGQFESEYPRQPMPDEWFGVRVKVDDKEIHVYDQETNTELLSIERLTKQVSNTIGLWTGFNSKGEYRNLKIKN